MTGENSGFAFSLRQITKRFGPVTALDNISLSVKKGSIHAVVGENGAGKTTLMRVLYGAIQPDSGEIVIGDQAVRLPNSATAIAKGVGMVSQHYAVIPELTNLQNLVLGAEPSPWINGPSLESRAEALARKMDFSFAWNEPSSELSPAGAQKLEILKLLWRNSQILILDEPTAMLSPADGDALFASLQSLVSAGATVILVTHRIPEVMQFCERVTVLRGGKWITEVAVNELMPGELAHLIVGDGLPESAPVDPLAAQVGAPSLKVSNLSIRGDRGNLAVDAASFTVRSGEVVGIAGVDGSGQRELFQAILGVRSILSGEISFSQQRVDTLPPARRIAAGLRIIPEDRHEEAIVNEWSLEENSILGLQRLPDHSTGGSINLKSRADWTEKVADRFATKRGTVKQAMASLSGGNQQRFVVARALESKGTILLAFQPTRGLDLAASARIYRAIRETAASGNSVLLVGFDLDDLLRHCDRILVMNRGHLSESASMTREAVGDLMVAK